VISSVVISGRADSVDDVSVEAEADESVELDDDESVDDESLDDVSFEAVLPQPVIRPATSVVAIKRLTIFFFMLNPPFLKFI
jgi:hypothetical protein